MATVVELLLLLMLAVASGCYCWMLLLAAGVGCCCWLLVLAAAAGCYCLLHIYVYIYTCMYVYIYPCVLCIYTFKYIPLCVYIYTQFNMCMYIHRNMLLCMYTFHYVSVCTCVISTTTLLPATSERYCLLHLHSWMPTLNSLSQHNSSMPEEMEPPAVLLCRLSHHVVQFSASSACVSKVFDMPHIVLIQHSTSLPWIQKM